MCIDDASGVVADTIEIAENQIRKDRQQEKTDRHRNSIDICIHPAD